jgi:hypothetical protein
VKDVIEIKIICPFIFLRPMTFTSLLKTRRFFM